MIIPNKNKDIRILIIDRNKEFNIKLFQEFKEYNYNILQAYDKKDAITQVSQNKNDLQLVILNIDFDEITTTKIFNFIVENSDAKIILFSDEDNAVKREKYFKKGILDFYLTRKRVDHIVDEISKTIDRLKINNLETILVLDNSEKMCKLSQNILERKNYKVLIANSFKDGLLILKNYDISLLVLDMELDDINGLDVLDGLRDLYLLNNFLVLATTIKNESSLIRDALKGGASNVLKKPFSFEEYLLKIDILVQSSREKKTIFVQKKEIEDSLKSFKELVDSTIGAMFIFKNNICTDCNHEVIKLLDVKSKKKVISKGIFEIFTDLSKVHQDKLLDNCTDHYFEDKIISKNGTVYEVQIKERNIQINNENLKMIAVVDITQTKHNEKMLSQQSKMASMGEMIGNIAHQWRQPLTAISIAASGIKLNYEFDMESREETLQSLDNIVENTQFLSATIEDFQNFIKNEKSSTQFSIQDTIKKTLTIIGANLDMYEINIVEKYSQNIQIYGIQNELIQVLLNIINNSVDILKVQSNKDLLKYIFINGRIENEKLILDMQDSAGGIPDDIIDKIFDPYFTTKHQSQGTGLGLYMTHQIISKLGGKITVINEKVTHEKKNYFGAKFTITLPLS